MKNIVLSAVILVASQAFAQDEGGESGRNQIIKLAITPNLIYAPAYIVSYERLMKENQTLNVTGGFVEFPQLFDGGTKYVVNRDNASSGFTIGLDYRFYLKKENKFPGPHGVYIAPFVNYYGFRNDRMISDATAATGESRFLAEISFLNIGGQLGYQFVLNDRWAFDFIFFGPAFSNYRLDLNLEGTFTVDEENEIAQEFLDSFPLLKELLDERSLTLHGKNSQWAPGYRFTAMVGYKFGKKKK